MADKKDSLEEQAYKALHKEWDPNHKNWKDLRSDHSVANSKGWNALTEKTKELGKEEGGDSSGLKENEIIDVLGAFKGAYEEQIKGKTEGFKEYRTKLNLSEARQFLDVYAQRRGLHFNDVIKTIQKNGLSEFVATYAAEMKEKDETGYKDYLVHKHVTGKDSKFKNNFAKYLKTQDKSFESLNHFDMASRLDHYSKDHLDRKHQNSYKVE